MFSTTEFSHGAQRVACMLMSVCIVALGLAIGAFGIQSTAHPGYTVTISQVL